MSLLMPADGLEREFVRSLSLRAPAELRRLRGELAQIDGAHFGLLERDRAVAFLQQEIEGRVEFGLMLNIEVSKRLKAELDGLRGALEKELTCDLTYTELLEVSVRDRLKC
jgi:hypothetical protein